MSDWRQAWLNALGPKTCEEGLLWREGGLAQFSRMRLAAEFCDARAERIVESGLVLLGEVAGSPGEVAGELAKGGGSPELSRLVEAILVGARLGVYGAISVGVEAGGSVVEGG